MENNIKDQRKHDRIKNLDKLIIKQKKKIKIDNMFLDKYEKARSDLKHEIVWGVDKK